MKRTKWIQIRVSTEEHKAIFDYCEQHKVELSKIIRQYIFHLKSRLKNKK